MARLPAAKKKTEEVIEEVKEEIKDEDKQSFISPKKGSDQKKKPKTPARIDPHRQVTVKNVFSGGVTYISPKSGSRYRWDSPGDTDWIEFAELKTMLSNSKEFLHSPLLLIDEESDSDVIEALGLTKVYENFYQPEDLEKLILEAQKSNSISVVSNQLKNFTQKSKDMLREKAESMVKSEQLYHTGIIKKLGDLLDYPLIDLVMD